MYRKIFTTLFLLLIVCTALESQTITNIKVNGVANNFSVPQGSPFTWQFNLPGGDSAHIEIWIDMNNDGYPDGPDKLLYSFDQIDGDTTSRPGQFPDPDDNTNGFISYSLNESFPVGHAILINFMYPPLLLEQTVIKGYVTQLGFNPSIITGSVTAPQGKSSSTLLVKVATQSESSPFAWDAITDANGFYQLNFGTMFQIPNYAVSVEEPFSGYVPDPPHFYMRIEGSVQVGNVNFSYEKATAKVTGHLRDDANNPFRWTEVDLHNSDDTRIRNSLTDSLGWFSIGVDSSDMITGPFTLETPHEFEFYTHALALVGAIHANDSISKNMTAYTINSSISGSVTLNGSGPADGIPLTAVAAGDSGYAKTTSEQITGLFSIPVSNKISVYHISPDGYISPPVVAGHPGDTGIVISIVTSVKERETGIPSGYRLYQNYPNPFNPSTVINYDVANTSHVQMTLVNVIGQVVAELINQNQQAGKYSATVDASNLPSGVYFYRMEVLPAQPNSQPIVSTRKMVLLK
ncbi:MAG: T9SS type A sorting domain-containing protein [Bacteroidota bacterium]